MTPYRRLAIPSEETKKRFGDGGLYSTGVAANWLPRFWVPREKGLRALPRLEVRFCEIRLD